MNAIDASYDSKGDFELVDELCRLSGVAVPKAIEEIRTAPVLHDVVCETEKMQAEVERILGI
jgi:threonine synthase